MYQPLSVDDENKLWPHQKDAVSFAINHLNNSAVGKTCLYRMPTGTGKTGVIGCLAMLASNGTTLVLTPWEHLRKQMVTDLKGSFWNKV